MSASRSFVHGAITVLVWSALRFLPVLPAVILSIVPWDQARAETSYGIQIAAYQDLDPAVERVNYLKRLGYSAFYHYETVPNKGKWYRVYIAQFPTRAQAKEEARVLQDLKLIQEYEIRSLQNGGSAPVKADAPTEDRAAEPASTPKAPPSAQTAPAKQEDVVYLLHVSSYRTMEAAAKEAKELEKAGQKAFCVEEDLASGRWFRVYLGKWETEKEARAAGTELKERGTITYFKPLKIDRAALSGGT